MFFTELCPEELSQGTPVCFAAAKRDLVMLSYACGCGREGMAQGGFLLYQLQLICVLLLLSMAGVFLIPFPVGEAEPPCWLCHAPVLLGTGSGMCLFWSHHFTYLVQL